MEVDMLAVILYSNDCPKCKILKSKLDSKNVQYKICLDMDLMISKGFSSMPMLEVNETTMNYLDAVNWVKGQ
jgi:glutaredoxin